MGACRTRGGHCNVPSKIAARPAAELPNSTRHQRSRQLLQLPCLIRCIRAPHSRSETFDPSSTPCCGLFRCCKLQGNQSGSHTERRFEQFSKHSKPPTPHVPCRSSWCTPATRAYECTLRLRLLTCLTTYGNWPAMTTRHSVFPKPPPTGGLLALALPVSQAVTAPCRPCAQRPWASTARRCRRATPTGPRTPPGTPARAHDAWRFNSWDSNGACKAKTKQAKSKAGSGRYSLCQNRHHHSVAAPVRQPEGLVPGTLVIWWDGGVASQWQRPAGTHLELRQGRACAAAGVRRPQRLDGLWWAHRAGNTTSQSGVTYTIRMLPNLEACCCPFQARTKHLCGGVAPSPTQSNYRHRLPTQRPRTAAPAPPRRWRCRRM